ncbi:MAG: hypothetical protein SXV54_09285 [Chloroflexota bacterium]|nr:hypothetical protein [Chloroflexota bacterium]
MPSANLTLLSRLLRERRQAVQPPYVLTIGSGHQFDLEHRKRIARSVVGSEDINALDTAVGGFSEMERYLVLRQHVQEAKPSPGYQYLVDLIRHGYFDLILTCQIDRSLEDALLDAQIRSADYISLVNGQDEPARIRDTLRGIVPRIKVVKVYGDLTLQKFAFTSDEAMRFCDQLGSILREYLAGHILIVNLAPRDRDVLRQLPGEGFTVWYVGEGGLDEALATCPHLKARNPIIIDGEEARFDAFFEALHTQLLGRSLEAFWEIVGITGVQEKLSNTQFTQLPELFVPPQEYDETLDILEREHLAVIIGEPHLGKTYAAFHILWRLFAQGFRPMFLPVDELTSPSGRSYVSFQTFLRKYLKDGHAVHLDDPFGKSRFLPNEDLISNLHSLVIEAKRANVRVLVTSRSSILYQAVGKPVPPYLKPLVMSLSSYTLDQRKDILRRYVELYKPSWAESRQWESVLEMVPAILVAPHNIELFVRGTVSCEDIADAISRAQDFNDLRVELGRMVAGLESHEILFYLTISALSSRFLPAQECKRLYYAAWDTARKRVALHSRVFMPWEGCMHRFGHQLISRLNWDGEPYYSFYHPVYDEAMTRTIEHEPKIRSLWSVALGVLGRDSNPFARRAAARDICQYCPAEHWELVIDLSNDADRDVRAAVAASIWSTLDHEPWDIIEKLAQDPSVLPRRAISKPLIQHWNQLPEDTCQRCLTTLLADRVEWTRLALAQELVACYRETFKAALVEMATEENEFIRVVLANELLTHYTDDFLDILRELTAARDDLARKLVAENAQRLAGLTDAQLDKLGIG